MHVGLDRKGVLCGLITDALFCLAYSMPQPSCDATHLPSFPASWTEGDLNRHSIGSPCSTAGFVSKHVAETDGLIQT